jgi:hypothetical protein
LLWRRPGIVAVGREPLSTSELQIRYISHVEGIYTIANGHPDLASVASEKLAVYHSAAAKRE